MSRYIREGISEVLGAIFSNIFINNFFSEFSIFTSYYNFWTNGSIHIYIYICVCVCVCVCVFWKSLLFIKIPLLILLPCDNMKFVCLSVWIFVWAIKHIKIDQFSRNSDIFFAVSSLSLFTKNWDCMLDTFDWHTWKSRLFVFIYVPLSINLCDNNVITRTDSITGF